MGNDKTFAYDPDAFDRDTILLTFAERGAWISVLNLLHHAKPRGILTLSLEEWSAKLKRPLSECNAVLLPLINSDICDGFQQRDGLVTISCRRMVREREKAERAAQKQARWRAEKALSDDDWLAKLKQTFAHVNVDHELEKMDLWIAANPGRDKSRRFILNWMSKFKKPVTMAKPKPQLPLLSVASLTPHPATQETEDERQARLEAVAAIQTMSKKLSMEQNP